MSDAAFATAAYPAYTTAQLRDMYEIAQSRSQWEKASKMAIELDRRERVAAGDVSVMTAGERLRWARR